ncbi:MAG: hypothetical protein MJ210_00975 [Alphaproteobacteria bacterium]|nr:hypothetical protein [Alphaproteobacteria bacterium]
MSHLPQSKTLLGVSPENLEIDCPNPYKVAKQKGCSKEILETLKPENPLSRCLQMIAGTLSCK